MKNWQTEFDQKIMPILRDRCIDCHTGDDADGGLDLAVFHAWLDSRPSQDLCTQLATDETTSWYAGYVMCRRLTQTEYLNAVRDVVGIEVDPRLEVPSDGAGGEGFDTNGSTLFTSPILLAGRGGDSTGDLQL
ncbi:DUF1587 domain-containing protein [Novipirellula artificiosorum]|uniref:Planctomycete cytochrome C n=1 Tax=Novipirellula artificiosorum TaxID=2528016 RepID=A0A5C6D7Q3_9BACT|nr:DUF1587 domain-containing protein [Novipirellula artificiosorum]TWU32850.1 hypothetical protein Poly41_52270 [Novipirellula artificiosorum]